MTTANMPQAPKTQTTVNGKDFTLERVFAAPRDLLFAAWSDPKHLAQWFGPKGWTLPVCKVDFRPGGSWIYCMRGPDGMESWGHATYQEIAKPERIAYVDAFADNQGNVLPDMPQMLITMDFIDLGGKTKLRSTTTFATEADLEKTVGMGMVEGVTETLDRLEAYVEQ